MDKLKQLPRWGVYALLAYTPFHIFVSQWAGTSIGGLEAWKVGKDFITIGLFILTAILVAIYVEPKVWLRYKSLIILALVYALLHAFLYLALKDTPLDVAALASTYNNRFLWIFFVGLGTGMLLKNVPNQKKLMNFIIIVSTIVCLLGLLQWVLPKDILTHFGYAKELGVKPNFFINEDSALPRVFSTLRDPNSFGAYLIIPILSLVHLVIHNKSRKRLMYITILGIHLVALYLSFSRAAWVGLLVGLSALLLISNIERAKKIIKQFWPVLLAALVVMMIGAYSVRNTSTFRSIVLKADDKNAASQLDSDEYHLRFIREGVDGVVDRPIGHGPATAGIVSIQLGDKARLTENYYVQIAYEVGIVGLLIFIAFWILVIKLLANQKPTPFTLVLLAASAAYVLMSMVMHLWTNEAVAYTYWGLVGLTVFNVLKRGSSRPA